MSEAELKKLATATEKAQKAFDRVQTALDKLVGAASPDKEKIAAKRTELKDARAVLKAAKAEETKLAKSLEREAKKAAKAAERQAAKEAKEAEREANRMPEQNGVRRPKPATLCGQVWAHADALSAKFGQPTPVKPLLEICLAEGKNEANVKAEYARWRKFNGVTGRVTLPGDKPAPKAKRKAKAKAE